MADATPPFPQIVAESVGVDFPVASIRGRSLKNVAIGHAARIGGRLSAGESTITIVSALGGISFQLNRGDRLALIGHNGSGKTTLIRVISGIYPPTAGRLVVRGRRVPMFDISLGLDEEASGYENIYIRGLVMGLDEDTIAAKTEEIAAFSELGAYLELPIRTYSSGMMLRLMFSIATCTEGDIVLLDEWIAVGDGDFREKANRRLQEITEQSGIVVLASHDLGLLRAVCNLALHLEGGRIRKFGELEDVLAHV